MLARRVSTTVAMPKSAQTPTRWFASTWLVINAASCSRIRVWSSRQGQGGADAVVRCEAERCKGRRTHRFEALPDERPHKGGNEETPSHIRNPSIPCCQLVAFRSSAEYHDQEEEGGREPCPRGPLLGAGVAADYDGAVQSEAKEYTYSICMHRG